MNLLQVMKRVSEELKLDHKWKHLPISRKRELLKGVKLCKDPECVYNMAPLPNDNHRP